MTIDDSSDMEGGGSKGQRGSFIKDGSMLSPVRKDDNDRETSSIGSKSKSKSEGRSKLVNRASTPTIRED